MYAFLQVDLVSPLNSCQTCPTSGRILANDLFVASCANETIVVAGLSPIQVARLRASMAAFEGSDGLGIEGLVPCQD